VTRVALTSPVVATLLPGAVGEAAAVERDVRSAGDRAPTLPTLEPPPARLVPIEAPPQMLAPDPGSLELADAERIVAFGRGAFHPEAVALVERLARALGAVVAGTRPAADEGWLPFSRQVGLTGAIVTPRLYVAVGISGAPYHLVGVKDPETLIAVNRDPEAPIFASAHLGLVGDLYEVLPALLERLEAGGPGVSLPGGGRLRGEGTDGGRRP
jgi:electron transfer flavoprotein alpha subunit